MPFIWITYVVNEMKTITEAATMCDMDQGDISSLIYSKVILPESCSSYGTGTRALLSERNLIELNVVKRLRLAGVKRGCIKGVLDLLRESKQSWMEGSWVVFKNGTGWFITSNAFEETNIAKMKENLTTVIVKI